MERDKVSKPAFDALAAARDAGLDKAVDQFPNDVIAAAQAALEDRSELPVLEDTTAEPWPPMRVGRGR